MRILSGTFKGISINTSSKINYRPTKSLVRKSIFDKFQSFNKKKVLDLFSGSGIMGFEAISRGAESITFVENNRKVLKLLRSNIKSFSSIKYKIYPLDVFNFLKKEGYYDFIFADPPYEKYDLTLLFKNVYIHLKSKGVFILECQKKMEPFLEANVLDYGNTRILYWKKS